MFEFDSEKDEVFEEKRLSFDGEKDVGELFIVIDDGNEIIMFKKKRR